MDMNDISNLASLLRENGDKVLNGQSKLSLTVALLKTINEAFTYIIENDEVCNSSFHVINTNNFKVEIFHDIQFLHDFVQKTIGLKLCSTALSNDSAKGALDICKFRSLKYLELRKVPVNTLKGIQSVRAQLQSIVCIRCIQRLEDLLLDCGADHSSGFVWSDLREAVFSYNGIDLLDRSLEFAPWLQILDLSHNRISHAEAVGCLPNLKYLNMSYNLLESVPSINKDACRKLQVLVIKNNYIEDLSGLVVLEYLMELDLSCNCLSDHDSLNPLLQLSTLTWLSLEGNPLSFHSQHRNHTARHLHDSTATGKFMLDRLPLSKTERLAVGSMGGVQVVHRTTFKEDASSAESSSASERTLVADRDGPSLMKPQLGHSNKRNSRVREAVISEHDGGEEESELSSSFMTNSIDLSTDHLETKKQIETLREKFGQENWLHSHAGSCVQDVLGLHKAVTRPSTTSPQNHNVTTSSAQINIAKSDIHGAESDTLEVEEYSTPSTETLVSVVLPTEIKLNEGLKETTPEPEIEEFDDEEMEKEDEEEGDEGEEQLYLVQRQQPEVQGTDEFFLVVTERWLKEREVLCGKTLEKWAMASLLSCVRIGGRTLVSTVQLTFDTVRRDRQERIYIMDEKEAQKLVRTLGEVLDARPLTAMNQLAFRCMKCSTQFSQELTSKGVEEKALTCPTCNSTLVIEMDEVPLPSHQREIQGEKQLASTDNGPPLSDFNSSPSQSSIGKSGVRAVSDIGASTVMGGGDRLQVTATIHHGEAQQPPSRSATSLDTFADSPNQTGVHVRRWDSDIEIISNPSQSSIEVLDEQARLQGAVTPARKRSSEERQMVSVTVPAQRPIVPNVGSQLVTLTGLTESSSSGSLTDSICTTYEIHSASISSRQGPVPPKADEEENVITLSNRNNFTDAKLNGRTDTTVDKLPEDKSDNPTCDESSTMLFNVHEEILSPQTNYASMLEGLLQSVGSKLFSKSPDKVLDSPSDKESANSNDRVKYSHTDFSVVDHRVKLHLYLHVFQQEQEELLFLVRAQILIQPSNSSYPGCLVVSTKRVYILQVTGEEGDDPEQWLRKIESSAIEMLIALFPLLWHQGIGMELLQAGGEQSSSFLFILQDQSYTVNFFSFVAGVALPEQCRVEHEVTERQTLALQQLLLSATISEDADPNICFCAVSSCCKVQRNEESKELGMGFIIVTATDLLLVTDNFEWLFSASNMIPKAHSAQKMSNLIEVEMEAHFRLILSFLDESAGSDESWTLKLGTESALKSLVSTIRAPWEQLFSVPLHINHKNMSLAPS